MNPWPEKIHHAPTSRMKIEQCKQKTFVFLSNLRYSIDLNHNGANRRTWGVDKARKIALGIKLVQSPRYVSGAITRAPNSSERARAFLWSQTHLSSLDQCFCVIVQERCTGYAEVSFLRKLHGQASSHKLLILGTYKIPSFLKSIYCTIGLACGCSHMILG